MAGVEINQCLIDILDMMKNVAEPVKQFVFAQHLTGEAGQFKALDGEEEED